MNYSNISIPIGSLLDSASESGSKSNELKMSLRIFISFESKQKMLLYRKKRLLYVKLDNRNAITQHVNIYDNKHAYYARINGDLIVKILKHLKSILI